MFYLQLMETLLSSQTEEIYTFHIAKSEAFRGRGVMLIIPSSLNPKVRNDLNYMNKKILKVSA